VDSWINCKHEEVNYYLIQMLSGHGCYRAYLHKFRHENFPDCPTGCGVPENAEHVFFQCPHFNIEREDLKKEVNRALTDNLENT